MIHAASWFCGQHCGALTPRDPGYSRPSPDVRSWAHVQPLVGLEVKYYGRMTTEARYGLCAASLALRAIARQPEDALEIGVVAGGFDGCLWADQQYFGDYLANGRVVGRGNLFIYTLPTSAAGAVSIALGLGGPMCHLHDDAQPVRALVHHAERFVTDGEADRMLALWTDLDAAVCLAVGSDAGNAGPVALPDDLDQPPLELAAALKALVRTEP